MRALLAIAAVAVLCLVVVASYAVLAMSRFISRQDCILDRRNANDVAENAVVITGFTDGSTDNLGPALLELERTSENLAPETVDRECGAGQKGAFPWER